MRIDRSILLNELESFSLKGSGMIIGKPGVGKSFILRQLRERLMANNVLSFIIKIDNAFDSSDKAIEAELGFDGAWISKLSKIKLRNEFKAVLIFDAFDAARDEHIREGFLTQIKKAKVLLKDKWNIIVSVRTYDAAKSYELVKLFSESANSNLPNDCRKFVIGELTDTELDDAFPKGSKIRQFLEGDNKKLAEILRVPFFLYLLESIFSDTGGVDIDAIKRIKSETQLLGTYWDNKIVNKPDHILIEQFLRGFTNKLAEKRSLSCSKSIIFKEKVHSGVFNFLRSENIIDEVSLNGNRLAYSHNILFDYAVSRLSLEADPESLTTFIEQDVTRPFFLRPSFVYFFTNLWYDDLEVFWEVYRQLAKNERKEFRIFVRLILNSTIASNYLAVSELLPLISDSNSESRYVGINNIFQSIRFLGVEISQQHIQLLDWVSSQLHSSILFDFAFLVDRAINSRNSEYNLVLGRCSRSFLSFILEQRQINPNDFIDRMGAYRGVDLVAKTFSSDIQESRKLLSKVLSILAEPNFLISYFSNLTEAIRYILPFDPEFVGQIYLSVFLYNETSTEKTNMGNSVVLSMTSNRRQDFEMCHFRLERFFPEFIDSSPKIALEVGIKIVNSKVIENEASLIEEQKFRYLGLQRSIIADFSYIWASGSRRGNKIEEITNHIIQYLDQRIQEGKKQQVTDLILVYTEQARVALLWRKLLQLASKYPQELFEEIYPLLEIPQFIVVGDISFEVRKLIKAYSGFLTSKQHENIESAIFDGFQGDFSSLQLMLSMLSKESLRLDKSKEFMKDKEILSNYPSFVPEVSITPYTTEDWLIDQGIDVSTSKNKWYIYLAEELGNFNNQYLNETPDQSEYSNALQDAIRTFDLIRADNEIPKEVFLSVLTAITKTVAIVCRNLKDIDGELVQPIKEIILFSFSFESEYDRAQVTISPSRGYSPTPKIEASAALAQILNFSGDSEFLKKYKEACGDISAIVRFNAQRDLTLLFEHFNKDYKDILISRLHAESDSFNYAALISGIYFKNGNISAEVDEVVKICNKKLEQFGNSTYFIDAYSQFLLWFLDKDISLQVTLTLQRAYKFDDFCGTVIFNLFRQLQGPSGQVSFANGSNFAKSRIDLVEYYLDKAGKYFEQNKKIPLDAGNADTKHAIGILDDIVLRVYFTLDVKEQIKLDSYGEETRKLAYNALLPVLQKVLDISASITDNGMMVGHTAHYFIETLNSVLHYNPKEVLKMAAEVSRVSMQGGYTFDSFAIQEVIKLTEKLLADHRRILLDDDCFRDLMSILDIYINSGWVEALELLWRLDEVFK